MSIPQGGGYFSSLLFETLREREAVPTAGLRQRQRDAVPTAGYANAND